jgi:hypothetical protein
MSLAIRLGAVVADLWTICERGSSGPSTDRPQNRDTRVAPRRQADATIDLEAARERLRRRSTMRRLLLPLAIVGSSVALALCLVAVAAFLAPRAFASTAFGGPGWGGGPPWMHGGGWGPGGFELPAELRGLKDVPADQRFSHFAGAQVNLKDKDGRPLTVAVTPGTATASSATSLTFTGNDGTSRTVALDDKTMVRGKAAAGDGKSSVAVGDKVVVLTLNGSSNATAVVSGMDGGGPWGRGWHAG